MQELFAIYADDGYIGNVVIITTPASRFGFIDLFELLPEQGVVGRDTSSEESFPLGAVSSDIVVSLLRKTIANYDDTAISYHFNPLNLDAPSVDARP